MTGYADGSFKVPPPKDPILGAVTQYAVPKAAWAALDLPAIVKRARDDEVDHPSIEANTKSAGGGKIRLTCNVMMTLRLINAWNAASELAHQKHDSNLLVDIANAVATAFDAIKTAEARDSMRPTDGIGKMAGER